MQQDALHQMLEHVRLLPVIRTASAEAAVELGRELMAAGLSFLEVSWTTPDAARAVEALRDAGATVGAGTILDLGRAREAAAAGAEFLVAPTFAPEVGRWAEEQRLAYLPGVLTPEESLRAYQAGFRLQKLFPAATVGPGHLKAMQEVFGGVRYVPTGGIGWADAPTWIAAGAVAVGMGGAIRRGPHASIRENLAAFRAAVAAAREAG
ncbi:MAG: bifunctional 4-hydroxy-2-oxoglutarate aldolase/2-dehydro-3-deoxy-phosphogluconate aldolase [Actinomycetia bacterium]|nr:bifunctional 4-hydroxy-2-oxoglutarate aldolase/2-dehydro-3-deoxy-phosphogluconate aldolase [Actinomycetes bacterium]